MSEFINTNGEKEQLDPSDYDSGISIGSKAGKASLDKLTGMRINGSNTLWPEQVKRKEERVLKELNEHYHANEDQYVATAKQEYADEQEEAQKESEATARAEVHEVLKKAA